MKRTPVFSRRLVLHLQDTDIGRTEGLALRRLSWYLDAACRAGAVLAPHARAARAVVDGSLHLTVRRTRYSPFRTGDAVAEALEESWRRHESRLSFRSTARPRSWRHRCNA